MNKRAFIQNKNHSRSCAPQDSGISALLKKAAETPDYNSRGWNNKIFIGNKIKNHSRMFLSGISILEVLLFAAAKSNQKTRNPVRSKGCRIEIGVLI